MNTIILNNLTENKTFKIKANNTSISFSQKKLKTSKNGNRHALSAVWKINNKKVLEIISYIKGNWEVEKKRHQYTFVSQEPSNYKLIVYVI